MGISTYEYDLNDCAHEKGFRFDIKFLKYNIANNINKSYYTFNELFEIIEKKAVEIPEEINYAQIGDTSKNGDVEPVELNMDNAEVDIINADYYKKILKGDIIKPQENSILISSVRPNLKKFVFIDKEKNNIYFTKAFLELTSKKINPLITYYALRSILFKNIISVARQGKGYPTLNSKDLKYILFDKKVIDLLFANQKELLKNIIPIFNKINLYKKKLIPDTLIISAVFNNKYSLDIEKLHELQKEKYNSLTLSDFANNKDMRNSCKFHCKSAQYAYNELKSRFRTKIKDFISEPIVLGASISPSDYDENGEYRYLSMASIKTWQYDNDLAQIVSDIYANNNSKKVKKDDIIIARSGEGTIGKVALIDNDDTNAIFCDFTMRIHLNNYNPAFAYYYFRTDFFQELIYGYKKGLGNNTNIFPIQIQEFPIPDIDLDEQQKIVDEIQSKINEQNKIKNKIEELRNSIDEIIENAIK